MVGSNRRESINRKLAQAIARLADARLAARFVQIDDLPMYNQDLESPLPASVARFKAEIEEADALLFVTPGAQPLPPGRPEECNRLGRAALRAQFMGRKARGDHGHLARRDRLPRSPSSICARFWATWVPS